MTITNQDLIDAAKAIGVELTNICVQHDVSIRVYDGDNSYTWQPQKNKSQLMDLLWKLKISPGFIHDTYDDHHHGGGFYKGGNVYKFGKTFQSFAEAIILAAAENYRAGVKKDA